jgi:uncharacterized protein
MNENRTQENTFGDGEAFVCKRCGDCCKGSGGIVLSDRDIQRLAGHLCLSAEAMLERYAEQRRGKHFLQTGADGYCIFFDQGCTVQPAKPDICRAWPFFRGNIEDELSWQMAQDGCPGIVVETTHQRFADQGRRFLREEGLVHTDADKNPRALCLGENVPES